MIESNPNISNYGKLYLPYKDEMIINYLLLCFIRNRKKMFQKDAFLKKSV